MEATLKDLEAKLRDTGIDPAATDNPDGFESGDSLQFIARCGNCHLKIARFDTRIFADGDGPDPSDWAGETYLVTESDDGAGMRKGSHSSNPPSHPEMGHDQRWTIICPGRRCRQTYVVGWERLSKAMVAAWRRGEWEILAGVDF